MAAIEEALLPGSTNCGDQFQGQNRNVYGASLANGLQWMCKTGEDLAFVVDLLVGLCAPGSSVIYWTGFSGAAPYNVELLS